MANTTTTAAAGRLVRLDNGQCRALVYPEQGFQLHGLTTAASVGGAPVEVIFGPPDGREPADRRYGNPVLFPSVGVTSGPGSEPDRWSHAGRLFTMQQHGWARDAYWHVDAVGDSSVSAHLVPTTGLRASFPFPFELRLRYALEGMGLSLSAELHNQGDGPFPYALGFHPYLRAPLSSGGSRGQCRVRLPAGTRLRSADSWRTIERTPAAARTIDALDSELPGSIVLGDTGATALELEDAAAGIAARVSVEESEQSFPVWVAWTSSPEAPYLCLEPWTDAPNALNRPGTRTIPPGGAHRYRLTISLRAL
jgi:galactose mutarotase-like enzyme